MHACDKCRVARGIVLWWNENIEGHDGEILLCGHHSDDNAPQLVMQGFQMFEDERLTAEVHPSLGVLTADPATH